MTIAEDIETLVTRRPGLTEAEIAAELFGPAGSQQRVSRACARLMRSCRIERSGRGGRSDPFRYFAKGLLAAPNPPRGRRGCLT
jgi:hypothetical protein